MDEKMDGERIQLHKKGEEFRYYSRKDKDYTVRSGLPNCCLRRRSERGCSTYMVPVESRVL